MYPSMPNFGAAAESAFSYRKKGVLDRQAALKKKYEENLANLDPETKNELSGVNNDLGIKEYKDYGISSSDQVLSAAESNLAALESKLNDFMGMDQPLYKMRSFLHERQKLLMDKPGQRQIGMGDKPLNLLTGPTTPVNSTGLITGK